MKAAGAGLRNANQNSCILPNATLKPTLSSKLTVGVSLKESKPEVEHLNKESLVKSITVDDELDLLYAKVGDIDNGRSPQLMPYYAKEIFSYLQWLESHTSKLRPNFLQNPVELSITPRMRHILFDWLVQVHNRLNLQAETLYLTMHIIDAYMSSAGGAEVRKSEYQLVGVTAMLLASKFEETFSPSIHDFVYLTDNSYTAKQVRRAERQLFSELDFFLGHPLPIQFLRRYSRIANATQRVHELAKYFLECISCRSYAMSHLPASALASASYCLAAEFLILPTTDITDGAIAAAAAAAWPEVLCVYSGYMRCDLQSMISCLASAVLQDQADFKLTAVKRKYARSNHLMISTLPQLTDKNSLLHFYCNTTDAVDGNHCE